MDKANITFICGKGFSEKQALDSLAANGSNVEHALSWLRERNEAAAGPQAPLTGKTCYEQGEICSLEHGGYGFIKWDGMQHKMFFHFSKVVSKTLLEIGDRVKFVLAENEEGVNAGKLQAIRVEFVSRGDRNRNHYPTQPRMCPQPLPQPRLPNYSQKPPRQFPGQQQEMLGLMVDSLGGYPCVSAEDDGVVYRFKDRQNAPKPGTAVSFKTCPGPTNVPLAFDVKIIRVPGHPPPPRNVNSRSSKKMKQGETVIPSNADMELSHLGQYKFVRGKMFPQDENRYIEFKALTSSSTPHLMIIRLCEKYVNAFVNSKGGTIYFGIQDNGRISGLRLDRKQRDSVRLGIDAAISRYTPRLDAREYEVFFHPVHRPQDGMLLYDVYVVAVVVQQGTLCVYETKEKVAWVRLDGSVRPMSATMLAERGKKSARADPEFRASIVEEVMSALKKTMPGDASTQKKESSSPSTIRFNNTIVKKLCQMGFERSNIFDCLYELQQKGVPCSNENFNEILNHLYSSNDNQKPSQLPQSSSSSSSLPSSASPSSASPSSASASPSSALSALSVSSIPSASSARLHLSPSLPSSPWASRLHSSSSPSKRVRANDEEKERHQKVIKLKKVEVSPAHVASKSHAPNLPVASAPNVAAVSNVATVPNVVPVPNVALAPNLAPIPNLAAPNIVPAAEVRLPSSLSPSKRVRANDGEKERHQKVLKLKNVEVIDTVSPVHVWSKSHSPNRPVASAPNVAPTRDVVPAPNLARLVAAAPSLVTVAPSLGPAAEKFNTCDSGSSQPNDNSEQKSEADVDCLVDCEFCSKSFPLLNLLSHEEQCRKETEKRQLESDALFAKSLNLRR